MDQFQRPGDREAAFQRLFNCFFPVVRRFFARKGVPPEDCHDLTQLTLLQVYENLDEFRRESAIKTWIATIAFNGFKKWLRGKKKRDREISFEPSEDADTSQRIDPEDPGPSQEEETVRKERLDQLQVCLSDLSARQRQSFTLYTYHDLSYKEISAVMKIEVGTVGALLNQARKKIEVCFEGGG